MRGGPTFCSLRSGTGKALLSQAHPLPQPIHLAETPTPAPAAFAAPPVAASGLVVSGERAWQRKSLGSIPRWGGASDGSEGRWRELGGCPPPAEPALPGGDYWKEHPCRTRASARVCCVLWGEGGKNQQVRGGLGAEGEG